MAEKKEKLRLCPFCGGDAKTTWHWLNNQFHYDFVRCQKCGNRTDDMLENVDKAITAWNTRTDDVLLEALEKISHIENEWNGCIPECEICCKVQEIAVQAIAQAKEQE